MAAQSLNLDLVLRAPDGTEVAVVKYPAAKYLKVLNHMKRPQVRPSFIDNPENPGKNDLIPNPVSPGMAIGLRVIHTLDEVAAAEDAVVAQLARDAAAIKPTKIGEYVQIKADIEDMLSGIAE